MTTFEYLAAGGLLATMLALVHIATTREKIGNAWLAGFLSIGFAVYSILTLLREGLMPVWTNHTTNLWGVQVWWDLLFAVGVASFFVVPRARAQNMAIIPWLLFVAATASIGLLAMVARLFWLESRAKAD